MANSLAFSIGRFIGKNKLLACLAGGLLLAYLFWPISNGVQAPPEKMAEVAQNAQEVQSVAAVNATPVKPCANDLDARLAQAKEKMTAKDYPAVIASLEPCRPALASGSDAERILFRADSSVQQAKDKAEALAKKRELAQWRKEGVTVGMSADRVLLSSWGKPESVNRTTNAFGVREQWVYGVGNYLYFKDGVLTSIQN